MEEFGKTKRREPTPDVTKDSSSSNESVAHPQVRNSYQSTPGKALGKLNKSTATKTIQYLLKSLKI